MQDPIVQILDESLEAIEKDIFTRTQCLERYPDQRGELSVLLDAALILRSAKIPTPSPAYFKTGRARLVSMIEQEQKTPLLEQVGAFFQQISTNSIQLRTATIALLLAFFFLIFGGGTVYASAHALPGDALYPLKTTLEDLRLSVASEEMESILYEQLAERRVNEIQALLETGREDEIVIAIARYEETLLDASLLLENAKPGASEWAKLKADHLEGQIGKHLQVLMALQSNKPDSPGLAIAIAVANRNIARLRAHFYPGEAIQEPVGEVDPSPGSDDAIGQPVSKPGGFGQPADTGKPEGVGKPDDVGKPDKEEKEDKEDKLEKEGLPDQVVLPDHVTLPDNAGKPVKEDKVK